MTSLRTPAVAVLFATLVAVATPAQEFRVKGAQYVKDGAEFTELFPKLIAEPLSQEEIDLFLGAIDPIVDWAKTHTDEWKTMNEGESEGRIERIKALGVWGEAELAPEEFVALVFKLQQAQHTTERGLEGEIQGLEASLQGLRPMAEDPAIEPAKKEEMAKAVAMLEEMLAAFRNYPKENIRLYEANKERVDRGLARFAGIAEKAEGGEPGQDGDDKREEPGEDR